MSNSREVSPPSDASSNSSPGEESPSPKVVVLDVNPPLKPTLLMTLDSRVKEVPKYQSPGSCGIDLAVLEVIY